MIHLLHPALRKLFYELQWKFIKKNNFSIDLSESIYTDVDNKENTNPLNLIDVGTKTLTLFPNNAVITSEEESTFRYDRLSFSIL